jgi:hypothetical protein
MGTVFQCCRSERQEAKSFYAFNMQSILAEGNTMDIKIYLTGLFSQSCLKETDREMWQVLTWSFHWLYRG